MKDIRFSSVFRAEGVSNLSGRALNEHRQGEIQSFEQQQISEEQRRVEAAERQAQEEQEAAYNRQSNERNFVELRKEMLGSLVEDSIFQRGAYFSPSKQAVYRSINQYMTSRIDDLDSQGLTLEQKQTQTVKYFKVALMLAIRTASSHTGENIFRGRLGFYCSCFATEAFDIFVRVKADELLAKLNRVLPREAKIQLSDILNDGAKSHFSQKHNRNALPTYKMMKNAIDANGEFNESIVDHLDRVV